MQDFSGRRVTVMGLGRHGGGLAVTRWLAGQGARVTVTDLAAVDVLRTSLDALSDVPVAHYRLGEHAAYDFVGADVVVVNPAVRPGHPLVVAAAASGAAITSEIELFLQYCPALVVGVTGSNGKSTTATLLAAALQNCGRRVWLGGNIGISLLPELPTMLPSDVVVLELSSFQLAHLSPQARMPSVAIVTSCTANHLDWHGSLANYVAAKQQLISRLPQHGAIVLGPMAHELSAWATPTDRRLLLSPLLPVPELPTLNIPGQHNRSNAACVVAAALHLGGDRPTIHHTLSQFRGLAHRLEIVANRLGRRVYNDSKATSPAAAAAALSAVPEPVWWLAGGHPKGADFSSLAEHAVRRARGAAIFGAARGQLAAALSKADARFPFHVAEHLHEALDWCWRQSAADDAILLSPGCASYDQYVDYADRGNRFVALIRGLG